MEEELEPVSILLLKKLIMAWHHVLNHVTEISGTIHLRKAVCTDHVDFQMLFAELQYLAALFLPQKDSSCFQL